MTTTRRLQIGVLTVVTVITVLLLFAPQQPPANAEVVLATDSLDKAVAEAVAMVQDPNLPPMRGIGILRQIAEENPEYAEAQFQLGLLSMQSRQYDKAVGRFIKVIDLTPERVKALFFLGNAYAALGNKEDAIRTFEKYLEHQEASDDREQVINLITELKNS